MYFRVCLALGALLKVDGVDVLIWQEIERVIVINSLLN